MSREYLSRKKEIIDRNRNKQEDEQEPSDNQQIEQCKVVQSSASLKLTKHVPTKT